MIISQMLLGQLSRNGGKCAIRFLGKDISYRELVKTVARLSYLFQKEIGTRKRIAIVGSNSPATVAAFLALSNNRSITIPVDPAVSDDEIHDWIYNTNATHVMATTDQLTRVTDIIRRRGLALAVIDFERKHGGEYATSYVPPADNPPAETDPILILRAAQTPDTQGIPKYALFSHVQVHGAVMALKRFYQVKGSDSFMTTMNWAHPFALSHGMLFPILSGATCVVYHGVGVSEFHDFLSAAKVSRLIDTSTFLSELALVCKNADRRPGVVHSITVGLGTLQPASHEIYSLMNISVSSCYGQVENLWTICMGDVVSARGLTGLQYKVLDENGDTIEGNGLRQGQLAVSGPTVMLRYSGRTEASDDEIQRQSTKRVIRGTWLHTGDIFKLEGSGEDLKLSFVKRRDAR
ncbi:MAG: class I adenylate-forming enzyme family protein [Bdellovibrionota bacterium]